MKTKVKLLTTLFLVPLLFIAQQTSEEKNSKAERVFHEARFDWGIMAGGTYGLAEIGNLGRHRNEVITGPSITGFQAGFFVHPQSDVFYVRTGLLYSAAAGDINTVEETRFRIQKLELPLLFGIRVYRHWCIEGGPVGSRILSMTETYHTYGNLDFGRNGLGYNAGVVWDNNMFVFKAALQGITYENPGLKASFRERNQVTLSVGYKFNGLPEFSAGTKKFRKVYIPRGKRKIRINYF